ncbi:MAG: efflux RND transporter permease subunit, partial [Gammaproteobacteria bacterium]|nr:efflux RND transporter permease subunit [Gammaproteobacteria bacterium]
MSATKLGLSGRIAKYFFRSEITPLLAIVGLLMGVFAAVLTPKEEDPQINVTFANVFIPYPGSTAKEVESLITSPTEQLLSEIQGVEHVYSTSRPGMSVLSVQFEVGENRTDALLRLYNKLYSHLDYMADNVGVGQPIIKPKGIDEVPVITLTLTSNDPEKSAFEISKVAHAIEMELKRIPGTNEISTIGAPQRLVKVQLDAQKMSANNIALDDLRMALSASNISMNAGRILNNGQDVMVQAGEFLSRPEEVATLVVGLSNGAPVFLQDVAEVTLTADEAQAYVWMEPGPQGDTKALWNTGIRPAVTIAIAKQPGTNAQTIATGVNQRIEQLRGTYIPDDIKITVTRDYGKTANDKANKLIEKLFLVTLVVVALVYFALGFKEALVVGAAVIVTLAITLFASWAFGFTLNRVSLFALIFSIGILVDDAIVVVENIHRHLQQGKTSLKKLIPTAVDEVGGPTILATFTVMAALLPMAFVSGLMGPYMSPIPINASAGMFISLIIAFTLTPWMMYKVLSRDKNIHAHAAGHDVDEADSDSRLSKLFHFLLTPFLDAQQGRARRWYLLIGILLLITGAIFLVVNQTAILKMLPFDNKSEFQVVVDMPEGTSLERTAETLQALSSYLRTVPEVTDIEAYAGVAAPINFNGLVRQYYLREGPNVGDLQVNLVEKSERSRKSHDIALAVRPELTKIAQQYNASIKVVEVPPGPPVLAPVVAEIYGQDYPAQQQLAREIRQYFEATDGMVDIDDTIENPTDRFIISVDRQRAANLGVSQASIAMAISSAIRGEDVSYLHDDNTKYPIPIRLELPLAQQADMQQLLQLKVRAMSGELVAMRDLVEVKRSIHEQSIHHKDLLPVVYVMGDGAGITDSPLYGMFDMYSAISDDKPEMEQALTSQPENPYLGSLKWDGEWQVTYETFRDMGIAYGVGLVIIYLLVVIQFRSYIVPLVIMAPIPLTIIGIMPGHALVGAQFTATSMIGMIALAGIIVRNSILLVDFINLELALGKPLQQAIVRSAV